MKKYTLGDLQTAIMRELWQHGELSSAEVTEALRAERGLAPTTIATMLTKLEKKGVVTHRQEGRRYLYRALVSEDDVRRSMVTELTERLFEGNAAALVSHLIEENQLDRNELDRIENLIARHGTEDGND